MAEYTLVCSNCKAVTKDQSLYHCSHCGGTLNCKFDLSDEEGLASVIKNAHSFWDYASLFPVKKEYRVTMGEGRTPLVEAGNIAKELGIAGALMKNETINPTGTFKDRCMSLSFTKALELCAPAVVLGSAGNAGAAAAAYAARAQLPCYVLVPASTPIERVAQTLIYGANMVLVRGTVTDCIEMITEVCDTRGWHNVTTACAYNPYQAEATKTIAYEIAQEMDWKVPDWILVPIGGGGILSGIYKGYCEMQAIGLIDKLPRMVGIQADGCASVVKAFKEGKAPEQIERWGDPSGIAVSIADPYPLDGISALSAIYDSNGYSEMVSDDEILKAQSLLASREGVFAEPASATTIAGLAKVLQKGVIKSGEKAVCIITGTGMKDPKLVADYVKRPPVVDMDITQLIRAIKTFKH